MTRTIRFIADIRDALAGPAARTTVVPGLITATIAIVAPMTTTQLPVSVQVAVNR